MEIIFEYGKHKGENIEKVMEEDPGYLLFIYRKSGFDGAIKNWIWQHIGEIREKSIKNHKPVIDNNAPIGWDNWN